MMKYRGHIKIEREVVIEYEGDFHSYGDLQMAAINAAVIAQLVDPEHDRMEVPWVENVKDEEHE